MRAVSARLLDGSPLLSEKAAEMLREHALGAYPGEALGAILADGSYMPLTNVSPEPERSAFAGPGVIADLMIRGELRAYCHSHPDGPDCPSETDSRSQLEMEVPFILVSTNGQATSEPFAWGDQLLDDRDLVGRPFRHLVDDCYAMIRACFRVYHNTELPEYPRNWEWWSEETAGEKDLYRRYFADAGFTQIDQSEVRAGDVWLAVVGRDATRSNTPNHAGYVLDAGLTLHHPSSGLPYDPQRLSKREPLARWLPYVSHWLRKTS